VNNYWLRSRKDRNLKREVEHLKFGFALRMFTNSDDWPGKLIQTFGVSEM
jgi:hypothetical protein